MLPKEWAYLASGTIRHIISLGSADNGLAIIEPLLTQIGAKARKVQALHPGSQRKRERDISKLLRTDGNRQKFYESSHVTHLLFFPISPSNSFEHIIVGLDSHSCAWEYRRGCNKISEKTALPKPQRRSSPRRPSAAKMMEYAGYPGRKSFSSLESLNCKSGCDC